MANVVVKPGDTLSGLLKASGNPNWSNPSEWTKYTNTPNLIHPGQTFNLPDSSQNVSNVATNYDYSNAKSVNPIAPFSQQNTLGGFKLPQNSQTIPPTSSSGFNLSSMNPFNPKPTYAADSTPSAGLSTSVPGNSQGERTGEVPMASGGRTPVVEGTPSWVIPILQKVSEKYNIPTSILSAVAKQESGFDPTIRQPDGLGRGMFQLDLGQHADVTEDEAFDPNFAADYAAKLLREGYDRTGSWEGALRYYNGGPAYNSTRPGYQGKPVNELTQAYANSVKRFTENTIPVEDPEWKKKMEKASGR